MDLSFVIKKPLITEKSLQKTKQGKFTFMVDKKASKDQIRKAVEKFFKIKVLDVWTVNMLGKTKRKGKLRRPVKQPDWKKAVVRLEKGKKIDLFEVE
jgi:large subunit ribosomal protein L23